MTMSRVVHFEIQADDLDRAKAFYSAAFPAWQWEDWSPVTGSPYWGIITGPDDEPGINGALQPRYAPPPEAGRAANAFVATIEVTDFDAAAARVLHAGGVVALPKMALTGLAWQGYFLDTEGNTFGLHQPDPAAA
jgi:predicted enzyme related to lactoylglutathione lyase